MSSGITVCIPTVPGRGGYLACAVASVGQQTLRADELIVQMDGPPRRGAAWTRTRALERATTEWVAFLDDDDYLKPEHLERLVQHQAETGADLVYPWFEVVGGRDPFPHLFGKEWDPADPTQTTVTMLVRREAALAVGGFTDVGEDPGTDAAGNRAGEEFRFVCKLHDAGYKIAHLAERTWVWRHHGANSSGRADRARVVLMRALVTGSAGFVGRNIARRLVKEGCGVIGVDLDHHVIAGASVLRMDCRSYFASDLPHRFDLVVHCAAIVGGRAKIDGDRLAIADNLSIDAEFFRWCRRVRPERVIYFSSSAAYPIALQTHPSMRLAEYSIDLTAPLQPDAMYGWAKLTGERLAALLRDDGVDVRVFRPFSGYGNDQSSDYPFPSFIERARDRADPFQIWGDGLQTRDFIHVEDLTDAVMLTLDTDIGKRPVNLGLGRAVSFLDLAAMVCRTAGYAPSIEVLPDKPVGVRHRVADTGRMEEWFTPRISLEEGIERALA